MITSEEERFRAVAQSAADAVITIDRRGEIVFWNAAAESIFGFPVDEAVGRPISLIIPERFRPAHQQGMERLIDTGTPRILGETVEMVGLHKEGREFPVELSLSTWTTQQEVYYTGIVRDITERKRANDEIESLARFPSENPSPILRVLPDGTIGYANPASAPLLALWNSQVGQTLPQELSESVADVVPHFCVEIDHENRFGHHHEHCQA